MTIEEEVLKALRQHVPWMEILKRFRGKSAIYSALAKFLSETDKILDDRYSVLEEVDSELAKLNSEKTRLKREVVEDGANQENLRNSNLKLLEDERQKKIEIGQLEARVAGLREKGYSPPIIERLLGSDARSALELLERVDTAEKCAKMKKELAEINSKMRSLEKEVAAAETKKQQIERAVVSKRNELDELGIKMGALEDAVTVVTVFFKAGYSVEEIKSLLAGLDIVGVAGDSELTIKRLVMALRKLKTIVLIDRKIAEKRTELTELEKAVGYAKSKLSVARETSLKSICEVSKTAKKSITELSSQMHEHVQNAADGFDASLASCLTNADNRAKQLAEDLKKNIGEWSELRDKTARVREFIIPGQGLFAILCSLDYLKKVDLPLVARLFDRLCIWFEIYLKDATARPSENIHRKDNGLESYHAYRLSVLVEFLSECLRQILLQAKKKNAQQGG
jgi:chromosome segregation ATPase